VSEKTEIRLIIVYQDPRVYRTETEETVRQKQTERRGLSSSAGFRAPSSAGLQGLGCRAEGP
jgi:hypothetical protein